MHEGRPSVGRSSALSEEATSARPDYNVGMAATLNRADPALADVVRRIVDAVRPEQILLFGSRARGDHRPDSDYDLLVVKQGNYRKGTVVGDIYMALIGAQAPVDIVVAHPEELAVERGVFQTTVLRLALRDGSVVYDTAA